MLQHSQSAASSSKKDIMAESIYDAADAYDSSEGEESAGFDTLPDILCQLEKILWFHPYLTRHQSDSLLQKTPEGTYLLRKRSRAEWGMYSLDIKGKSSVKHFPLTLSEEGISLGSHAFSTVPSLLSHFQSIPVLGDEAGSVIECRYPYPREVDEFQEYQEVACHFLHGNDSLGESDSRIGLSAATKEGYLRKQGAVVKNWKTRWFVLKDNHLTYYPNHKNKKSLRELKIEEITFVLGDDESTNHFRIVLPWRTFYIEAPTLRSKKEWMSILRWKLEELKNKKSKAIL